MASNPRFLFFFLLALSFSLHTHARDSKFFNKFTKNTKDSTRVSPVQESILAPTPSPSPEFKVVEHGYGLYGQDPPTTTRFGEEFSKQSTYPNNNFNAEKQGMSDTRFLENGKYFYDANKGENKGNGYGNQEKQGMSDTRFLENGKYFYDVNNQEGGDTFYNTNNNGNGNGNGNENNNLEGEKQGVSDTRFLENGKYWYGNGIDNEEKEADEEPHFGEFNVNNGNGNGKFETEKQGMSDTRFLENGKYFYDVNNEKENNNYNYNYNSNNNHGYGDVGFHNKNNIEYANSYNGNGNGNNENNNYNYNSHNNHGYGDVGFHNKDNIEYANSYNGNGNGNRNGNGNGDNEYETQGRGGYNYPNKFPKYEYDTMEEYDREQGYVDGKDEYVP